MLQENCSNNIKKTESSRKEKWLAFDFDLCITKQYDILS